MTDSSPPLTVTVVVEQLRRRVEGGIGTYARGLLQGLVRLASPTVDIALYASRPSAQPDPLADLGFPLDTARWPPPVLTRLWDRGWSPIPRASGIVHSVSLATPPARGQPLTVMVHDLGWRHVPEAYPRRGRHWHEQAFGRALKQARYLVAPSEEVCQDLRDAGAGADQVVVISEGCDHLPAADVDGARRLLETHGVRGGYLLTVSTLEPRKNLPRLLAAYAAARPALADAWPLVVVGPEGWGRALEGSPIPHGVVPVGRVTGEVLSGLYRGARCMAYVPLVEGFGLPPVEAMRECVPVVASHAVPSVAAVALTVEPTDTDAIADALVRASNDEALRSRLVSDGVVRAGELTWEAAARHHVELWSRASSVR